MTKQARIDIANAAEAIRLVMLASEKERPPFLSQSDKAALMDARAVLTAKLLRDVSESEGAIG